MITSTINLSQINKYGRINQRCERERSNEIIEAGDIKQQNDIEIIKTSVEVARSRKKKMKEGTRKKMKEKWIQWKVRRRRGKEEEKKRLDNEWRKVEEIRIREKRRVKEEWRQRKK